MLKMDFVWTLAPCTKSANLIIERHVWSSPEYHLSSLQWVLPHLLPILWYVVATTRRKLAGKKFQPTFLEFSLSFHGIRATYLQKNIRFLKGALPLKQWFIPQVVIIQIAFIWRQIEIPTKQTFATHSPIGPCVFVYMVHHRKSNI